MYPPSTDNDQSLIYGPTGASGKRVKFLQSGQSPLGSRSCPVRSCRAAMLHIGPTYWRDTPYARVHDAFPPLFERLIRLQRCLRSNKVAGFGDISSLRIALYSDTNTPDENGAKTGVGNVRNRVRNRCNDGGSAYSPSVARAQTPLLPTARVPRQPIAYGDVRCEPEASVGSGSQFEGWKKKHWRTNVVWNSAA